jgi:hypothetical protein
MPIQSALSELYLQGCYDDHFSQHPGRVWVIVQFEERDQAATRDDDGATAKCDNAEYGDLTTYGHLEVPDGGNWKNEDVEVFENVLVWR